MTRISRRGFLKATGIATIPLFLFPSTQQLGAKKQSSKLGNYAILYDESACVKCYSCVDGCREWNKLEKAEFYPYDLTPNTWVTIKLVEKENESFDQWHAWRRSCHHCEEPACESVCPAKAITKFPEGPVVIDKERCFGCKYCIIACPFHVPKFDEDTKTATKCTMCIFRVKNGLEPACVAACPTDALVFGKKKEIKELALKRAKEIDGYIYGLEEAAGTNVILVLKAPPSELGLPEVDKSSYSSSKVLNKILIVRGGLGLFGVATLAFIGFILWRREMIGREKIEKIPG